MSFACWVVLNIIYHLYKLTRHPLDRSASEALSSPLSPSSSPMARLTTNSAMTKMRMAKEALLAILRLPSSNSEVLIHCLTSFTSDLSWTQTWCDYSVTVDYLVPQSTIACFSCEEGTLRLSTCAVPFDEVETFGPYTIRPAESSIIGAVLYILGRHDVRKVWLNV